MHVAVDDHQLLVGHAHEAFDVVDCRAGRAVGLVERLGVAEDDDVPAVGLEDVVEVFLNQEAVARPGGSGVGQGDGVAAHRAFDGDRPAGGVALPAVVNGEAVAALVALDFEVFAQERGRHRAGGDDERFDDVGAEDERQDEGDNDRFEGFFERLVGRAGGRGLAGRG